MTRYLLFAVLFIGCGEAVDPTKPQPAPLRLVQQSVTSMRAPVVWKRIAGFEQVQKWDTSNKHAPSISLNLSQTTIGEGGILQFRITSYHDTDNDRLSFWWTSRHGSFLSWNDAVTQVSWRAPFVSQDTRLYVHAYAADGRGRIARKTICITVKRLANHTNDLMVTNFVYAPIVEPRAGELPIYYPGESVKVSVDVYNAMRSYARGVYLGFWLTTDGKRPPRRPDEDLNLGNMRSGEQKTRQTNFQIPTNAMPGIYTIVLHVDWTNAISESNESDNMQYLKIRVAPSGTPRR